MQCNNCSFLVPKTMKFALMKNICPACGSALLGETEERKVREIISKLKQQSFSKDMNDVSRYDCALFVFNEIQRELSSAVNRQDDSSEYKVIEVSEDVDPENMKQLEESDFEFDKEALKKEYLKTLESKSIYNETDDVGDDFVDDDEDDYSNLDERAARLKKTYKRHKKMIQKSMGGSFRRIGDE